MQKGFDFLLPDTDWQAPDMASLPDLSNATLIGVDTETCDPDLLEYGPGNVYGRGHMVGYCLAAEFPDGSTTKMYLPVRHENGVNVDADKAREYVRDSLSTSCTKAMANAAYDVLWLRTEGIEVHGKIVDVQNAAALLDEHAKSYSLNALGERYLDEKKSEGLLYDAARAFGFESKAAKGAIHVLPPAYVGTYGEQDADLTMRLYKKLRQLMSNEDLDNVFDLETKLAPVLWNMRWMGVRFDTEKALKQQGAWAVDEEKLSHEIKSISGESVDVWSADSVRLGLERAGVTDWPVTGTGLPSFTGAWLENHPHILANKIKTARKIAKAKQFLDSLIVHAQRSKTGDRIHATTNQLRSDDYGTVSGRLSMSQPNLQQIPGRDPVIGPILRGLFLPEQGQKWISADYSSQEPRIMMHFVKKRKVYNDHPLVQEFATNPKADLHSMVSEMMGVSRSHAKTINLGIMYGMGVKKLAEQLGTTMDEARTLLDKYSTEFPFITDLRSVCTRKATDLHGLKTLSGRMCRFTYYEPTTFGMGLPLPRKEAMEKWPSTPLRVAWTFKSLNRLIQGSSADQNKAALVQVYERGILPAISIHDEICASGDESDAETIKQCMETAVPLEVPVPVDVEMGETWGDIPK